MSELINRSFKFWGYTVSHCILILRSPLLFPDQDGFDENHMYNIDIEFLAVTYVDISTTLHGIEIRELDDNIPAKLQHLKENLSYKVFEIISEEKIYYIVAGSYRIGKNRWITEDRISNMNLEYDSIIEFS